jgi:hypothetical protein
MALNGPGLWAHSRYMMFPDVHNLYTQMSFPADGLPAAPLVWLFGWPAGFTLFTVLVFAGLGAGFGLLAASWWRSLGAGLCAAAVAMSGSVVLREVVEGRLTHAIGLVLVPLVVWGWCRAQVEDRGRYAFVAGLALGFTALVFWYQAVWTGLTLFVLVLLGRRDRLPVARHLFWVGLGTFAVAAFPLIFTISSGSHPGSEVGPWDYVEEVPGQPVLLAILLEMRDALHMGIRTQAWAPRFFLLALTLAGLWRARKRRVLAPILWILVGWGLALGPYLDLPGHPIVLPTFFQSHVPLFRRYWWPDRYLIVALPGVVILASGAVARFSAWLGRRGWLSSRGLALPGLLVALLVLIEAEVWIRDLPLLTMHGAATARTRALQVDEGPMLVLPPRDLDPNTRQTVWNSLGLLDQPFHGRPLLTGPMNPESVVAGAEYRAHWSTGFLRAVRACEQIELRVEADADFDRTRDRLARAGLKRIYLDPSLLGPSPLPSPYKDCIESLVGPPVGALGPLLVYELPAPGTHEGLFKVDVAPAPRKG